MPAPDPYDLVPYEAGSDYRTRPAHLALTSWLHGGPRPRVEGVRLLDLGCGTASNLLPLAFYDPSGSYVGIDTSRVQIELAEAAAAELGLENVRLLHGDAGAAQERLGGPFDLVILHAVYSWVEPAMRPRLLELARDLLADDGLLFVSFNTYPGWKIREAVRRVLLLGTQALPADEPQTRIARARELAITLRGACPERPHPYYALIANELERVINGGDFYLLHEYLAPFNDALWIEEFVERAEAAGLSYLADSQFNTPAGHTPPTLGEALSDAGYDPVQVERGIDFLLYRQFRAAILCRADADRLAPPTFADVEQLWVATELRPDAETLDLGEGRGETFRTPDGNALEFVDAPMKAVLADLARSSPAGRRVREVIDAAELALREAGAAGLRALGADEWQERFVGLHLRGMAELRLREPERSSGDTPHLLARCEARLRPHLTTPYHTAFYPAEDLKALLAGPSTAPLSADELAEMKRWGLVDEP